MKASAVIVAAGSGQRLGRTEPKAFVKIGDRSMVSFSLRTIAEVSEIEEIVIAVPAGIEKAARAEVADAGVKLPVKITAGGAQRQDSVRIALALVSAEAEIVVVHDAARPFADADLFGRCIAVAQRSGGGIAATPVSDTLKRGAADGTIAGTVARAGLWRAETPQAFQRYLLVAAHERAVRDRIVATDDSDLVEQIGGRVELVEGRAINLKITTPADLALAELLAANRKMPE
jgi:2-C-methyl-D-erythritol 4-phosphate cytidylyltransferase